MNGKALITAAALCFLTTLAEAPQAAAAAQPFEFHADGTMIHKRLGPVEKAYGYMTVVTDGDGAGTINVMFSNGSKLERAQFNARVKFLGAGGKLLQEKHFDCWIDAEGLREPGECKVSRPLTVRNFDKVEVDFYLTDIPEYSAALVTY